MLVSALCVLLTAVALTVAPGAPANIIIGQSIAGVNPDPADPRHPAKLALRAGAPMQVASTVEKIFIARLSPVGHGVPYAVSNDGQRIVYSCSLYVMCIRRVGAALPRRIGLPCHRGSEVPIVHVSDDMGSILLTCEQSGARTLLIRVGRSGNSTTTISTRLSGDSINSDGSIIILYRAGGTGPIYAYRGGHLREVASGGVPFGVSRNGRFLLRARPGSSLPGLQPELLDVQTGTGRLLRLGEEVGYPSDLVSNDGRILVYDAYGFQHAASSPCPPAVLCSTTQLANTGSGEELNLDAAADPGYVFARAASDDGCTLVTTREEHPPGMRFQAKLFIQSVSP
jgi:hypothetical protein